MAPKSPRRPTKATPRRVALHEAGHAVMAHVLGQRLWRASIKPDEHTLGRVARHWRGIDPQAMAPRMERRIRDEALVSLAGDAAERIGTGRGDRRATWETDRLKAASAIEALTWGDEGGREAWLLGRLLRLRADRMLRRHWPAVLAVAGALEERREIPGGELARLVRAARVAGIQRQEKGLP